MSIVSVDPFRDVWKNALAYYKEATGKNLTNLKLEDLGDIKGLEAFIDQENKRFEKFRARRANLFKVLQRTLIPVELLSRSIGGATNLGFPPSSLIFGAIVHLISAARNVSNCYDAIEELLTSLQDVTIRLKLYCRYEVSSDLRTKLVEILVTLLEVITTAQKVIKRGRILGFGRNIVLEHEEKVQLAVRKLERLVQGENLLVGAEMYAALTGQIHTVNGIATTVSDMQAEILQSRSEQRDMHDEVVNLFKHGNLGIDTQVPDLNSLKDHLRPSVYPEDTYERLLMDKIPGTGDWVFEEKAFTTWGTERVTPLIFLQGIPGAGKSVLSANIISHLSERYPQSSKSKGVTQPSICYFFFKENNPSTRSVHQALRDCAYQMCLSNPDYAKFVISVVRSFEDIKTIESIWRRIFAEFFIYDKGDKSNDNSASMIVLDGFDEADVSDRRLFLTMLRDIRYSKLDLPRLQVMLVGRPDLFDEITGVLDTDTLPTISVDSTTNSDDIAVYVQTGIRKSRSLSKVTSELQAHITKTLIEQANGMFLWVYLMMRELAQKNRQSAILEALKRPPSGLKEMIQQILERLSATISPEDAEDLNEILLWVTCAKKPLTMAQLNAILKCKSPIGEGVINLEFMLRRTYASFFSLNRDDRLSTVDLLKKGKDDPESFRKVHQRLVGPGPQDVDTAFDSDPHTTQVTFCHASIGDVFCGGKGRAHVEGGQPVGVDVDCGNTKVLKTVLQLCADPQTYIKAQGTDLRSNYAMPFCYYHLRDVEISRTSPEDIRTIGPLLMKLCRDRQIVNEWVYSILGKKSMLIVDDAVAALEKWIYNNRLKVVFSDSDQMWIDKASKKPASCFAGVARVGAMNWLQKSNWNAYDCCSIVSIYRQMVVGVSREAREYSVTKPEVIQECAEWLDLERDALWYGRLGCTYHSAGFHDEAYHSYSIASWLNPKMAGKTLLHACAAATIGNYEEAINRFDAEIKLIETECKEDSSIKFMQAVYLAWKGHCHEKLHESEQSYKCHREGFLIYPFKLDNFIRCAVYLDHNGRFEELLNLWRLLDGKKPSTTPSILAFIAAKYFPEDFSRIFGILRRMGLRANATDYLVSETQRAIEYCRRCQCESYAMFLENFLAEVYCYDLANADKAVEIWERLSDINPESSFQSQQRVRWRALRSLARSYFNCRNRSEDLMEKRHIRTLQKLRNFKGRSENFLDRYEMNMLLGCLCGLSGESDQARAYFREIVDQALRALSGHQLHERRIAFLELAYLFLYLDDMSNAEAMFQKFYGQEDRRPNKVLLAEQQTPLLANDLTNDEKLRGEDDLSVLCDGQCHTAQPFKRKDLIWKCRNCFEVDFCNNCLPLLKERRLPVNICSPNHSWIAFQPTLKIIPADKVLAGKNEFIDLETWKAQLRKDWNIRSC